MLNNLNLTDPQYLDSCIDPPTPLSFTNYRLLYAPAGCNVDGGGTMVMVMAVAQW